ncbi:c-type cytochrome [Gemmata sp. G18]|uniref:C-type cytochrome n=1 Tax=Gemmata palustris TaxID=2822762 RepID=A0ABS5C4Z7_9BACT|nr:c-type cytochrome [Gemmata palustris]MBP3961057.1 c-type cytochrome [Gemmata palustris]
MTRLFATLALLVTCGPTFATEKELPVAGKSSGSTEQISQAEKGYKALTQTAFIPAFWTQNAIPNAWKQWGVTEKPANYTAAVLERYGLHTAPYPNDGLPMGLRKASRVLSTGVGIDCMLCHAGSIDGKSTVGLGNTSLDVQTLFEDLAKVDGLSGNLPFTFSNVRGTSEAGGFGVYLLGFRNPDLTMRTPRKELGLRDDLCEDVPAWWLMKKKKTIYHTGATDSRSVRTLMQFMMHPLTMPKDFEKHEPAFRDIQQYLINLEPPKYPYPVDEPKAAKGKVLFNQNCAACHGTYGEKWTYPNKVIPLDEIGTDPTRHKGIDVAYGKEYSASWFGKEKNGWFVGGLPLRATAGYQAPPLDGIWATAPYFHNGSVPTLDGVLSSKARPKRYTRSFKTDEAAYDKVKVGWKVTELRDPPSEKLSPHEARKIYDTSKPGRSSAGHIYGDDLTAEQRAQVIEYLKTL